MQRLTRTSHCKHHRFVEDLQTTQDGGRTSTVFNRGGVIGDFERETLCGRTGFDEVACFVRVLLVKLDAACLEFGPIFDVDHSEQTFGGILV